MGTTITIDKSYFETLLRRCVHHTFVHIHCMTDDESELNLSVHSSGEAPQSTMPKLMDFAACLGPGFFNPSACRFC